MKLAKPIRLYSEVTRTSRYVPNCDGPIDLAPEITGDDLITVYPRTDGGSGWVVAQAAKGAPIAYGSTRETAIRVAADTLQRAGRNGYQDAMRSWGGVLSA